MSDIDHNQLLKALKSASRYGKWSLNSQSSMNNWCLFLDFEPSKDIKFNKFSKFIIFNPFSTDICKDCITPINNSESACTKWHDFNYNISRIMPLAPYFGYMKFLSFYHDTSWIPYCSAIFNSKTNQNLPKYTKEEKIITNRILGNLLGNILSILIDNKNDIDSICCVPTKSNLDWNVLDYCAEEVSEILDIPIKSIFERISDDFKTYKLKESTTFQKNIILIIDDIITSSETLNNLASLVEDKNIKVLFGSFGRTLDIKYYNDDIRGKF